MAYDLDKWVAGDQLFRRKPWLRWAYTAPLVLAPAAFVLEVGEGFGSPLLAALAGLLWLGATLGFLLTFGSPFLRDVWLKRTWQTFRRQSVFDERERHMMAQAQMTAFHILVAAILALFLYVWLALRWGWWLPGADDLGLCFHLFILTTLPLPVVVAEWITPLPPPEEEDA